MTPNEQFLLEEAAATRELISRSIAEARALERICLVAAAGVWAWLLTHDQGPVVRLGYWIPFAFSVLALIRVVALALDTQRAAGYLRQVEARFLPTGIPEGWERRRNPTGRIRVPAAPLLFWLALVLVTLLVPILLAGHAT